MYYKKTLNKQTGMVLVTSLIMLLSLTLIGVTGMQATSLEEKMAGNRQDQNISFQAAESTLLQAEKFILDNDTSAGTYTGGNGLLGLANAEPGNYFLPEHWEANNSRGATNNFGLPETPRYIIKKFSQLPGRTTFRVTARAIGKSSGTQVILQSTYTHIN